jgi:FAD/FMN-containing dehydrogenase
VIAPGDAGYDKARTVFIGGIDRRPAVIVRVADATDVARVVSLACESGLELAIRSGGHSSTGHSVNVMPAPPMPFVPAEHHGKLVILALMCYAGATEAGQRAVAPFRALATPIADMVRPMGYPEMYLPEPDDYHPTAAARTMFVDRIDREVAETIVETLHASDATMRVAQLRVLGGAMARVPVAATAFAHRQSRIMVNLAAFYTGPEDQIVREAWVADFAAALNQGDSAAYMNFLGDEGEARVRDAYPGSTWERLVAIKRRYDPTNLFRLNQNIPPKST